MKSISITFIILLALGCSQEDKFEMIRQSPEKYHNEEVEIEGILYDKNDDYAIYRVASDTVDASKAISVEFSDIFMMINTFEGGLGNMKLKIKGTFNKDNKGSNGGSFGTVEDAVIVAAEDE